MVWRESQFSPEGPRRLLNAVLTRAVRDIVTYAESPHPAHRECAEQAWCWLWDDAQEQRLTSFRGLCGAIGINPVTVRHRVSALVGERLPWVNQRTG